MLVVIDEKYLIALEALGLQKREVAVFTHLLLNGAQNGNQLAQKLSIERTAVYRYLRKLVSLGLLASSGEVYNCVYYVDNTQRIIDIAEQRAQEVKDFVKSIPFISEQQLLHSKVRVYRGEDSIVKVYREKNRSRDPIVREIANDLLFPNIPKAFWEKEIQVRKTSGSFLHMLVDKGDQSLDFHRTNELQFKEVRVIPSDFTITAGINIFKNKVAFHNKNSADPLAIVIEDQAMSLLLKNFFDFVWQRSQVI